MGWIKDKLYNRKIEGESSTDALEEMIVVNKDTNRTEIGNNLYVDGTIYTGGGVEIADNLVVTTADIHTITANQNLNIRTTNDIVLQGSNTSISVGEEIEFDNVPQIDTDFTNFHEFDIYSAFAFRPITEEEITQYELISGKDYFISTTYTQKQVLERILKERLHLLKFHDEGYGSYNSYAIYNIVCFNSQALSEEVYLYLFYGSTFGNSQLSMLKRLDNVAIFEYQEL